MRYVMMRTDDMLNGDGLRIVLFLSSCSHYCPGCHNPETWDSNSGEEFDDKAKEVIMSELEKDYISGITFSGGDPLNENNLQGVLNLIKEIKIKYPNKNIWLYTGYTWEEIMNTINLWHQDELVLKQIIDNIDVLVDGRFVQELADVKYHWAGSTNQRVIDVQKSLKQNKVILYI